MTPVTKFNCAAVAVICVPPNCKPFVPSCDAILKSFVPSDTVTSPFTVNPVNVPTDVICVCAASTLNSLPDLLKPVPAVITAELENCVNAIAVVPTVILPVVDKTKPVLAFVVPSSINVKAPAVTSVVESKSVALVGAPLALTV